MKNFHFTQDDFHFDFDPAHLQGFQDLMEAQDAINLAAAAFKKSKMCAKVLEQKFPQAKKTTGYDFICDTCGWYHGKGSPNDPPATAGSGGCHTYQFLKGTAPSCAYGQPCNACKNPTGTVIHQYTLSVDCKENCSPQSCS